MIRHGSIAMNDEEWEEGMETFVDKLANFTRSTPQAQGHAPLDFLPKWQSPLTDLENQMEALTEPGRKDAEALGYSFAHLVRFFFSSPSAVAHRLRSILTSSLRAPIRSTSGQRRAQLSNLPSSQD